MTKSVSAAVQVYRIVYSCYIDFEEQVHCSAASIAGSVTTFEDATVTSVVTKATTCTIKGSSHIQQNLRMISLKPRQAGMIYQLLTMITCSRILLRQHRAVMAILRESVQDAEIHQRLRSTE